MSDPKFGDLLLTKYTCGVVIDRGNDLLVWSAGPDGEVLETPLADWLESASSAGSAVEVRSLRGVLLTSTSKDRLMGWRHGLTSPLAATEFVSEAYAVLGVLEPAERQLSDLRGPLACKHASAAFGPPEEIQAAPAKPKSKGKTRSRRAVA